MKWYSVHLTYDEYVDVEADTPEEALAEAKQTVWPGDVCAEIESERELNEDGE